MITDCPSCSRKLRVPDDLSDWGLRCGWGMAWSLIAGGLLSALRIANGQVLFAWVVAGALLWTTEAARWRESRRL